MEQFFSTSTSANTYERSAAFSALPLLNPAPICSLWNEGKSANTPPSVTQTGGKNVE